MTESNRTYVNNESKINLANQLVFEKQTNFTEKNIVEATKLYSEVVNDRLERNTEILTTSHKMLRLLDNIGSLLVSAHTRDKNSMKLLGDLLTNYRNDFSDCLSNVQKEIDNSIFYWYDTAAKSRNMEAYVQRARCYLYGIGVTPSLEKATKAYREVAYYNDVAAIICKAIDSDTITRKDFADIICTIGAYSCIEGINGCQVDCCRAEIYIYRLQDLHLLEQLEFYITEKIDNTKNEFFNFLDMLKDEYNSLLKKKNYCFKKLGTLNFNQDNLGQLERNQGQMSFLINDILKSEYSYIISKIDKYLKLLKQFIQDIPKLVIKLEELDNLQSVIKSKIRINGDNVKFQKDFFNFDELISESNNLINLFSNLKEVVVVHCFRYILLYEAHSGKFNNIFIANVIDSALKGDKKALYNCALCIKYGIGIENVSI